MKKAKPILRTRTVSTKVTEEEFLGWKPRPPSQRREPERVGAREDSAGKRERPGAEGRHWLRQHLPIRVALMYSCRRCGPSC